MVERSEIRQARKNAGLTQLQAAKAVGNCLRTWQMWEQGDRAMPESKMREFLRVCGGDPEYERIKSELDAQKRGLESVLHLLRSAVVAVERAMGGGDA